MTLDEAIKHEEKVAEEKENEGKLLCQSEGASIGCLTCAEKHRQLANWLKELKSLREQKCEDAISRQAVLEIITEQERLASDRVRDTPSSLDNGLHTWVNPAYTKYSTQLSERSQFKTMIQTMPPVTPQPKTGHWVEEIISVGTRKVFCSECGCSAPFEHVSNGDVYSASGCGVINKTKFCPNCGAKMEEGSGEE